RQLSGLHKGLAARDEAVARGLQRFEPRTANRSGWHPGSGREAGSRSRADRHRPPAPPVQPAARGDAAFLIRGLPARERSTKLGGGGNKPPPSALVRSVVAERWVEPDSREGEAGDRAFVREEVAEVERRVRDVDVSAALDDARREEQPLGSSVADALEAADDFEH